VDALTTALGAFLDTHDVRGGDRIFDGICRISGRAFVLKETFCSQLVSPKQYLDAGHVLATHQGGRLGSQP